MGSAVFLLPALYDSSFTHPGGCEKTVLGLGKILSWSVVLMHCAWCIWAPNILVNGHTLLFYAVACRARFDRHLSGQVGQHTAHHGCMSNGSWLRISFGFSFLSAGGWGTGRREGRRDGKQQGHLRERWQTQGCMDDDKRTAAHVYCMII